MVTVGFTLIPSIGTLVATDQLVRQEIQEEAEKKAETMNIRANQLGPICQVLEAIIGDIRDVQNDIKPSIVEDIGPISLDLDRLYIPDPELERAVTLLKVKFNPNLVRSQSSALVDVKDLILNPEVEMRIKRVEYLCAL